MFISLPCCAYLKYEHQNNNGHAVFPHNKVAFAKRTKVFLSTHVILSIMLNLLNSSLNFEWTQTFEHHCRPTGRTCMSSKLWSSFKGPDPWNFELANNWKIEAVGSIILPFLIIITYGTVNICLWILMIPIELIYAYWPNCLFHSPLPLIQKSDTVIISNHSVKFWSVSIFLGL